ncbi:hypothetical protein HWV62_22375 [Athelia sp. TMB]|nr:hypothetical protein HWV62_22375 [Athelia sp. TMB]
MNIISSHFAISLYAKATFLRRAAVPLNFGTTTPVDALEYELEKYSARGFNFCRTLTIANTIALFNGGSVRTVGDRWCWTLVLNTANLQPQSHFTRSSEDTPENFIRSNSWRMVAAGNWTMMHWDSALAAIVNGDLRDMRNASPTVVTSGRIGCLYFPSQVKTSASSTSPAIKLAYPAFLESRSVLTFEDTR